MIVQYSIIAVKQNAYLVVLQTVNGAVLLQLVKLARIHIS